jgi:hypothetical protein
LIFETQVGQQGATVGTDVVAPSLLQGSMAQAPVSAISMFLALASYELRYQRGQR